MNVLYNSLYTPSEHIFLELLFIDLQLVALQNLRKTFLAKKKRKTKRKKEKAWSEKASNIHLRTEEILIRHWDYGFYDTICVYSTKTIQ